MTRLDTSLHVIEHKYPPNKITQAFGKVYLHFYAALALEVFHTLP